jgi:16S rRNA (guanine1516-N2)-methyltransferase
MRLLRLLAGDDQDSGQLLARARMVATGRVVVKRPRLAPALAGPAPDFTISGKNSRFDVYLIRDTP